MSDIKHGLAWSEKFELGNEEVDSEHRRLFQLLSELIDSCMDGTDTLKLKETLDFLVNYTVMHFHNEEALQVRYNYPDYKRHKQLHENFKCAVGELVQKFEANGSSAELSNDVNRIIVQWLVRHIQQEDQKIGAHIRYLESRHLI